MEKEEKVFAKAGKRSQKVVKANEEKIKKEERKKTLSEVDNRPIQKKVIKKRSKLEKRSKNYRELYQMIDKNKIYQLDEAIELVKKISKTKFDSTIEIHFSLNVDPKHADQNIRDNIVLPHGNGRKIKVAVFSDNDEISKESGADYYGIDTIIKMIEKNKLDFQVLITTPKLMPKLAKYAKTLGPKGLMPNPKSGTVTEDLTKSIIDAKNGKIEYRVDSYGIIHVPIAKVSFSSEKIKQNIEALYKNIIANKPQSVKSNFVKSIYLTTTMGPSIKLNNNL